MFFQRIKTPGIAHTSYILGGKGEAIVVDPRRDVDEYLRMAREKNLSIKYVFETHRQEDFVLGSRALSLAAGAEIVNGRHELFGHGDIRLEDGDEIACGGFRIRALHTPGHTPESMCYAVFVSASPERAWGVFTGDTLFIGETGRTDLPDPKRTGENAAILYAMVHEKILPLGDQALLFPAHGSGSVCGGNIADRDDSTLGLERTYNPVFALSRDEFVQTKLKERIPRPPYFQYMEKVNLEGGLPLAKHPSEIRVIHPRQLDQTKSEGIIIDARDPEAFAGGHIPGSYSIWAKGLPVFGGWVADPTTRVYLVLPTHADAEEAILALARIGVDRVEGILAGGFEAWRDAGLPIACSGATTPRALERSLEGVRVLDVREDSEFEEEGHIEQASHIYVGYIEKHLGEMDPPLDKSEHIAVACSVGHRASLATSILLRLGYEHVDNLLGGMTAWQEAGMPRRNGMERSLTTIDVEGART